jgi:hypothetical protein
MMAGLFASLFGRRPTILEQQALAKRALDLLDAGETPEGVKAALVLEGTSPRRAVRLVEMVLLARQHGVHLVDRADGPGDGR